MRLSHWSEFNSGTGECFHCSRWTVIERNRDKDHLDLLTPRTRTWIDEMKEVSNVFQFHFNCCLKLKETIRPRSVLHLGPEMDPVPPQRSWLHITTAVWQKWQGWCHDLGLLLLSLSLTLLYTHSRTHTLTHTHMHTDTYTSLSPPPVCYFNQRSRYFAVPPVLTHLISPSILQRLRSWLSVGLLYIMHCMCSLVFS